MSYVGQILEESEPMCCKTCVHWIEGEEIVWRFGKRKHIRKRLESEQSITNAHFQRFPRTREDAAVADRGRSVLRAVA